MRTTNLNKLIIALSTLNNEERLSLDNDTFLTGFLDGSDKIYGWFKLDDNLYVESRDGEYPIEDMEKEDISYIFGLSGIYKKIINKEYNVDNLDEFEVKNFAITFGIVNK